MLLRRIAVVSIAAAVLVGGAALRAQVRSPAGVAESAAPEAPGVTYKGGQLRVVGDGATLNQILSEVGGRTGMRVVGRIPDEPVYGVYGPGSAAAVLASLLQGTGVNMVLTQSASGKPGTLMLTARTGGVTAPASESPQGFARPQGVPVSSVAPRGAGVPTEPAPGAAASNGSGAPGTGDGSDEGPVQPVITPEQQAQQVQDAQQRQKALALQRQSAPPH